MAAIVTTQADSWTVGCYADEIGARMRWLLMDWMVCGSSDEAAVDWPQLVHASSWSLVCGLWLAGLAEVDD